MKRILSVLISAAIALSLCGCAKSGEADEKQGGGKLSVVTTIFPAYDFARQVFGDTAEVTLLLNPGTESHTYDPTARDIVKIGDCDLFIYNGGESDEWVENILSSVEGVSVCRMMDAVEAVEEEHSEGMQAEESGEHHHEEETEYDEHIWTSTKNAAAITEHIGKTAESLFPENSGLYKANADAYAQQILALDGRFAELLSGEERYFVFGDRFPLLYFFREYGLNYYAAFPGCGSEVEPSAQTISFLMNKLSGDEVVPAVFCIELSNRKLADTLAQENGLPVVEFHTCHNITADDFTAGETYLSLMERNYGALLELLQ